MIDVLRVSRRTAALAALLVLAATSAGAQDGGELRIDSVEADGYPDVTAVVTAPGRDDGTGFGEDDFEVTEDGAAVDFTVERIAAASLEVMLVIDTSGSMDGEPMNAAKVAAGDFLGELSPQVRVGAVSFGPDATLLSSPTIEREPVVSGVAQLFASGETALYDAVRFASEQFSGDAEDRTILVLSDGGDTASATSLADAVAAVGGVRVDVIELVTTESDRSALDQLAGAGGGTVASTSDPEALRDLYRLAAGALANQYRIGYESSGVGEVDLTVRLNSPSFGTLDDSMTLDLPDVVQATTPTTTEAAAASSETARVSVSGDGEWSVGLLLGAVAVFLALSAAGVVVVTSGDGGRRRRARARLGLRTPTIDRGTATRLKERMATDVDSFLERQGRRRSLEVALDVAGIALRPGEFIVVTVAAGVVAAFIGLLVAGLVGAALMILLVPLAARVYVSRKARRRRAKFADALPDNLQMLTSSLRSGYSLLQALDAVAQEATEPSRAEFRRVILEVRVGRDTNDALRALAGRMQSTDFDWVVGAIDINRDVGGDLAVILDTVSDTIRERQQVARQIRALTAEGRLSVYILTGLPIVLAMVLSAINPGYLDDLRTGGGLVAVGVGVGLLVTGWVWMSRIVRIDY